MTGFSTFHDDTRVSRVASHNFNIRGYWGDGMMGLLWIMHGPVLPKPEISFSKLRSILHKQWRHTFWTTSKSPFLVLANVRSSIQAFIAPMEKRTLEFGIRWHSGMLVKLKDDFLEDEIVKLTWHLRWCCPHTQLQFVVLLSRLDNWSLWLTKYVNRRGIGHDRTFPRNAPFFFCPHGMMNTILSRIYAACLVGTCIYSRYNASEQCPSFGFSRFQKDSC